MMLLLLLLLLLLQLLQLLLLMMTMMIDDDVAIYKMKKTKGKYSLMLHSLYLYTILTPGAGGG